MIEGDRPGSTVPSPADGHPSGSAETAVADLSVYAHGRLSPPRTIIVDVGLTPLEAIDGATRLAADVLGPRDRGRIARGHRADLLLVDGDPASDITAIAAIVGVQIAGGCLAWGALC